MEILLIILLVIIAYILWRIYRQKEDEKDAIYNEKLDTEHEQARKEKFKDYPHLIGNMDDSYLEIYGHRKELNLK